MSNRHLARTIALQTLFAWDFNRPRADLAWLLQRNLAEFAPDFDDHGFTQRLLDGVLARQEEIDALIVRFAPEWPLDQITAVDRNILRLGVHELKFDTELPPKVAINEAIELAKTFGSDSSSRFVNGVLGSIYKEMVASGERQPEPVETETGPAQVSAGGVVYRRLPDGQCRFALILDAIDRWTFPKGKQRDDEVLEDTARREIGEEVGLTDLRIIAPLGSIQITVNEPGQRPVPKTVHYFLAETDQEELRVAQAPEIHDAGWFEASDARQRIGYDKARGIFDLALAKLNLPIPGNP